MPKPCSLELRERVVDAVESGASWREAAEWFEVSPSSAIKWMQRQRATGRSEPTWFAHGGVGCESKACLTQPDWCFSMRPPPRPTWCGFAAAVHAECD
jgi:hypothetical protein